VRKTLKERDKRKNISENAHKQKKLTYLSICVSAAQRHVSAMFLDRVIRNLLIDTAAFCSIRIVVNHAALQQQLCEWVLSVHSCCRVSVITRH